MDAKVTLSFNAGIIEQAKAYAEARGLSLSRLTEILLKKVISGEGDSNIESIPLEDWVSVVAEGEAVYKTKRNSQKQKRDFYESRK